MRNNLEKDFKLRKSFHTNRSSAIFPILFFNKSNDFYLSILNYWSIKNNIDTNTLVINLRIYDQNGYLVKRDDYKNISQNLLISIRKYITQAKFSGMVEVEIISTSNLRFNFPALTGFYKSRSLYSCVHSAGRIKGAEEVHSSKKVEETNWSCKFEKNITPFFHFINSSKKKMINFKNKFIFTKWYFS